jgi:hypothetical protein
MNREPTIMKQIKYQTLPQLDSYFGCISTPVVSTPRNINPAHPSVVVKINRALIA